MKRDWKPGDVAMLTDRYGHSEVGLCIRGGVVGGPVENMARWRVGSVGSEPVWSSVIDARPLVVIDPEDREQVERLCNAHAWMGTSAHVVADMQAALREFANPTPPKPDEPLGLGAVVEDVEGHTHTRARYHSQPWVGADGKWRAYADVDAVKVLSNGVQA